VILTQIAPTKNVTSARYSKRMEVAVAFKKNGKKKKAQ
jgi:hypothetical protein